MNGPIEIAIGRLIIRDAPAGFERYLRATLERELATALAASDLDGHGVESGAAASIRAPPPGPSREFSPSTVAEGVVNVVKGVVRR